MTHKGELKMSAHPFISLGKKTTEIPVKISYRIIELFSGGLYSSPNCKSFASLGDFA
jgi:hypothetical protein